MLLFNLSFVKNRLTPQKVCLSSIHGTASNHGAVTTVSTEKTQFKVKGDQRLDQIKEASIILRAGVIKVPQTSRKMSRPMLQITDRRLQEKLYI